MNSLDCRNLLHGDSFGVAVGTQAGILKFSLNSAGGIGNQQVLQQAVTGAPHANAESWGVSVSMQNGELVAGQPQYLGETSPAPTAVAPKDVIMWHAQDRTTPPFSVSGYDSDGAHFNSAILTTHTFYVHRFGHGSRVVKWVDANGTLPGTHEVDVKMPTLSTARDYHRYMTHTLATGSVVTITDQAANPDPIQVDVNQAVVFWIESSKGISIVDKTLVGK